MLESRFNPPLHCVKTLNAKALYARRDGRPNLPYSSRAIEVKKENTLIEVPLLVSLLFAYTRRRPPYTLFQLAAAFNVEEPSPFGVALALEVPPH